MQKLDVVNPQTCIKKKRLASILRVDYAGEYGAVRIYQGQLSTVKDEARQPIQHMYEQECRHLEYFSQEIIKRQIRPSLLQPLWHCGGYLMGLVTAWLGKDYAMICTVAVEDVIEKHYAEQLCDLKDSDTSLEKHITKFREEEIEHKNYAMVSGTKKRLGIDLLYHVIKYISHSAIWVAKRL